ncbi:MAG: hypothetical protein NT141_00960 [candidate division WWE3 bacterium]|nr:hypothetical protein [candidate division WWE3 bacterium]
MASSSTYVLAGAPVGEYVSILLTYRYNFQTCIDCIQRGILSFENLDDAVIATTWLREHGFNNAKVAPADYKYVPLD